MHSRQDEYITQPYADLQLIHGVEFPAKLKFRQLLVTGPPGSGKSTLIANIRGWPEEGYIDLSMKNWWKSRSLSMRPREIHLGFPCVGHKKALAVFDDEWKKADIPPDLDLSRVKLPPIKKFFFSTNWRNRYFIEFLIPPVEVLFRQRENRAKQGTHPVDDTFDLNLIKNQVAIFRQVAFYLFEQGMNVYIREVSDGPPLQIKHLEGD